MRNSCVNQKTNDLKHKRKKILIQNLQLFQCLKNVASYLIGFSAYALGKLLPFPEFFYTINISMTMISK